MTAASLIAFLRAHPKTCGVLGIVEMNDEVTAGGAPILHSAVFVSAEDRRVEFVHEHRQCTAIVAKLKLDAISGASTAKADEMDLIIERDERGTWCGRSIYGDSVGGVFCPRRPTRLHATFAAIEAALDKETTT